MKVVRGFDKKGFRKWRSVITIGGFDGIHIGHAAILEYLGDMARSKKGKSVVITFDPLPREFFRRDEFKVITTVDEKLGILEEIGVDGVFVISFSRQLSQLEAVDFLEKLWNFFHPLGVVVGLNHHFGRDCKGGISLLRAFTRRKHMDLQIVKEVMFHNEIVSSTRIRKSIARGDVKEAYEMLGRPFSFSATVGKGNGIGTVLSYPTANLEVSAEQKILPMDGVYAAKVSVNGSEHGAMLYLGKRPTFYEKAQSSIETYIMGYKGNLYGKEISVRVIERIRAERKFSSPKSLKNQIMNDEVTARKIIKKQVAKQGG